MYEKVDCDVLVILLSFLIQLLNIGHTLKITVDFEMVKFID